MYKKKQERLHGVIKKQKMMRHPRETVEKRIQNVKKMEKIIFLGEEEEQVFIASAKGRNGPNDPYTPDHAKRNIFFTNGIYRDGMISIRSF